MGLKENILAQMKKQNLNQAQLSKKAVVAKSTLSSILRAKKESATVNLDTLRRLAEALNISTHALAYGEPDIRAEDVADEILTQLFSGTLKVDISRVDKRKRNAK